MNSFNPDNRSATQTHAQHAENDASAWTRAGQAWRPQKGSGSSQPTPEARSARVSLVNTVLSAMRRHERGTTNEREMVMTLRNAVEMFNRRVA